MCAYFCLLGGVPTKVGVPTGGLSIREGVFYGDPPSVTSGGGHCSGQYAFYWNAFLLFFAYAIPTTN